MDVKIKSYKKYGIILILSLVALLTVLIVSTNTPKPFTVKSDNEIGMVSYYTSPTGYAEQCGNIYKFSEAVEFSQQVPENFYIDGPVDSYIPSGHNIIPIYGYLSERGMSKEDIKFYSPETVNKNWTEQYILRTMWDYNNIVIWYNPDKATDEDIEELKQLDESLPNNILILPWLYYDNASMPLDRTFAFARLGFTQSCNTYNFNVLSEFGTFTSDNKLVKPEIPEIAELNSTNNLNEFTLK